MRKDLTDLKIDKNALEVDKKRFFRIFSKRGVIFLLIIGFLSVTSCYVAFTSYMIFYQPNTTQRFLHRMMSKPHYTKKYESYREYPYFMMIRQIFGTNIKSPFGLFVI
jgi:hypothetical protein